MKREWFSLAFWNTAELMLTRIADAATSFFLLTVLPTETFAGLALMQAYVAPIMFFLISPANILYREFARWQEEGAAALKQRLFALRLYGVIAFSFSALVGAAVIVWLGKPNAVWSGLFAWSLLLGIFLSGGDREYLRLALKMRWLCAATSLQKGILVGGLLLCWFLEGAITLRYVAVLALTSQVLSALFVYGATAATLKRVGSGDKSNLHISLCETLTSSFIEFSFWNHASGVVYGWIQTMDLFFLGIFGLPAFQVGLYASTLKLGNFAMAIPNALTNLFAVWTARKSGQDSRATGERRWLIRSILVTTVTTAIMGAVVVLLSPQVFEVFSRGRWSSADQLMMRGWLIWIVLGLVLSSGVGILTGWAALRLSMQSLFLRVYLPFLLGSVAVYVVAIRSLDFRGAALGNVGVSVIFLCATVMFLRSSAGQLPEARAS